VLIQAGGGAKGLSTLRATVFRETVIRTTVIRATVIAALVGASLGPPALASPARDVDANRCRAQREQRDALATQAMEAELTLVRKVRETICPRLTRQAEQANANTPAPAAGPGEPATDYQALIHCRQQTEQALKASHPLLYRNRLGFVYYTRSGADLARQADAVQDQLLSEACPAWLRGEPEPAATPGR